jgi:hypothetical protein
MNTPVGLEDEYIYTLNDPTPSEKIYYDRYGEITYVSVKVWQPSMKNMGSFSRALISTQGILAKICDVFLSRNKYCILG